MHSDTKSISWVAVLALVSAVAGCQKEEERRPASEEQADAGAVDKAAQIDPSLAKAMAVASARAPVAEGDPSGAAPATGILGPGQADQQIKQGAQPELTMGNQGQEPRYPLTGSSFRPGTKLKGAIQVAVQQDVRQGALPVEFDLSFEAKALPAQPGAASGAATQVVAKVNSAATSLMGLPEEVATALKQLKGSRVEYQVAANGAGANFTPVAVKGQEPDQWLRALSDALATVTLPYPDQPVGTGAYWKSTSREMVMGVDTVTHRLVRVQRADPTQVTLTIETKRFAASPKLEVAIAGLPDGYALAEFQSGGDGTIMLAHGQPLPYKGLLKLGLGMLFANPTQQDQKPLSLGLQGQARLTFDALQDPRGKPVGDDTGQAAGQPLAAGQPPPDAPAQAAAPAPAAPAAPAAQP